MGMNNSVDKFFNQKLSEHMMAPNEGAWSRIASGLPKKNKTIIWFRAAAVLLLVILGGVLWNYINNGSNTNTNNQQIAEATEIEKLKEATSDLSATPKSTPEPAEKMSVAPAVKQVQKVKRQKATIPVERKEEQFELTKQLEVETVALTAEIVEQPLLVKETGESKSNPIVIVYELKPIPKEQPDENEFMELPEKKSTLRRVLTLANDVRSGDSKISGLRQTKEEILAFNFKKEDRSSSK